MRLAFGPQAEREAHLSFMSTPFNNSPLSPPQAPPGIQRVYGPEVFGDEFITPEGYTWNARQVLGPTAPDIEMHVGPELFAEMSRDNTIYKCRGILKDGVLQDDLQFAPGATEDEAADSTQYKLFVQGQHFAQRVISGLDEPYWVSLGQMLDLGWEQGHAIAETVWEEVMDEPIRKTEPSKVKGIAARAVSGTRAILSGFFRGAATDEPKPVGPKRRTKILDRPKVRLMPKRIKVKPHGAALFCVDAFRNVLGLVPAWLSGRASVYQPTDLLSRDKFLVFTNDPRANDPRGMSAYWPLVNWYGLKKFIPRNYLKYLLQEALPIPVMNLPEKATGWYFQTDPLTGQPIMEDGRPKFISAVESGQRTIEGMYNGKGLVVPFDVKVTPYQGNPSKGDVFPKALEEVNGQMEDAFLMQRLAQSTSPKQSKSAAQVHEGRLGQRFFWYKRVLAMMTLYDLIAVAFRVNLGDWALAYLPLLSFGDYENRDWNETLKVIAQAYFWGFIDDTMRVELCAWMGLPKPGPSRFELGATTGAVPDINGNPVAQNDQRPDKQPGQKGRNDGNSTPKETSGQHFETLEEAQEYIERLKADVATFAQSRVPSVGNYRRGQRSFVGHFSRQTKGQSLGTWR
jgi:hypothetical protein